VRRAPVLLLLLASWSACGHGAKPGSELAPAPVAPSVNPDELDRLWNDGIRAFRHGQ